MLDRERADFFRVLGALQEQLSEHCVAIHLPIGAEHELTGIVDLLHMCAYTSPEGQREGKPTEIPAELQAQVDEYHTKLLDAVVETDEALMERYLDGEELAGRGGRARAEGRGHARRAVPGRLRRRDEEPRHDRAARPARRGRAVAGEEGRADRRRRRRHRGVRLQDDRRSVRRAGSTSSASSTARSRPTRPSSTRAGTRRSASGTCSSCRARSTTRRTSSAPGDIGAVAKLKETQTGDLLLDAERDVELPQIGFPEPVMSFAVDAEGEGRRGEDGVGPAPARRGGSDDPPQARPADRGGAALGAVADPRRGRGRAAQAPLRRRRRAAPAARAVPRDDPQGGARARALQEADRRPRPVRRLPDRRRAARGARGLRVRRQDRRRRHPAELPARRSTRASRRRCSTASSPARRCRACA